MTGGVRTGRWRRGKGWWWWWWLTTENKIAVCVRQRIYRLWRTVGLCEEGCVVASDTQGKSVITQALYKSRPTQRDDMTLEHFPVQNRRTSNRGKWKTMREALSCSRLIIASVNDDVTLKQVNPLSFFSLRQIFLAFLHFPNPSNHSCLIFYSPP